MKIKGRNYRTVWLENKKVRLIDQTLLPEKFRIYSCKNCKQTAFAIKNMIVRGAPAIGAAAAFGFAQGILEFKEKKIGNFKKHIKKVENIIKKTRPTAHDLFQGVNFVKNKIDEKISKMMKFVANRRISACQKRKAVFSIKKEAVKAANEYANLSVERCRKIGKNGNRIIKNNSKILTHCNAGALACVDYGTALSPLKIAKKQGKKIFAFVDETRPRLQGAKLTAFELSQEKIPHAIIADNAAGHYMQNKMIDLVIVGADRIALNGDVANKIGTYEKAVLAKENKIPFYVAAPLSTFDKKTKSGKDIPIEERSPDEVLFINGKRIAPKQSKAKNPSFDVTPAKYIKGIITEKGIIKANKNSIYKLLNL